jgi:hypothetical protein
MHARLPREDGGQDVRQLSRLRHELLDLHEAGELWRVSVTCRIRLLWFVLVCALAVDGGLAPALAQAKRVALIIGNNSYAHIGSLANAKPDARAIRDSLTRIGFDARLLEDLDYPLMRDAIRAFGRETHGAEMAVLYFAGHGVEVKGDNWLLPVTAELKHERDLEYESISLSSVLAAVQGASRLRLVILDACRNNPFAEQMEVSGGRTRTVVRGLGRIEPPGDVLVAYSAKHGTVAEDGAPGEMSPFASGLQMHLATPGLDIRILMGRVRDHVIKSTKGRQEPFTYGSVGGDIVTLVNPPTVSAGDAAVNPWQDLSRDELSWLRATASNRLEAFREYLNRHPDGKFKDEAQDKIQRLTGLQDRWGRLKTSRDRIDLETFVIDVAGTEFSELAKQRLIDIYLSEERDWNAAEETKLWKTYEAFLREWPRGRHSDNANERLRELADIKSAWEKLASSDDEQVLDSFVRRYGWSEFGAAATSRLIALRREKATPQDDNVKTLTAEVLQKTIDGRSVSLSITGMNISFDTNGKPAYRPRLGKDFFRRHLKQSPFGEGSFKADAVIDGRRQVIEGLGAIIKSQVDGTGSIFFLQMHGNERSAAEVNAKDRKYAVLRIMHDYFGTVCVMTAWESILSDKEPEATVERCRVHR